ncbi:Bug family tripartite tricarboxylate transporter substrate binding protein [Orrella sp. 11846]|uniref:Bug family tripartite tricarboxylate transporter substrate binding protein n=1 Tax=Orrella sp. 11846 TaxID=3409913 RepID=UPI003B59A7BA
MKTNFLKRWVVSVCVGLSFGCAVSVANAKDADNYPERPVKILVGFSAGGTTDIIARAMAGELVNVMPGAHFVVDNKPGAGGDIGTADVVRSNPDGYTLLMASVGPLAINPSLKTLKHDPRTDLAPIILVADVPNVLVVHPDRNIKTFEEFLAWAKERRGNLHYASTGTGTSSHLSSHMLSDMMDLDATHVPYKGAEALNDLVAGRTDFMFATIPSVMGQIKSGKLVPIAVSSAKRSRSLPDIPAVAEKGFPDFSAGSWFGLLAPADTPPAVVNLVNEKVNQVLPTLEERLISAGADPAGGSPEDFGKFISAEHDKWAKALTSAGIEKQ